MVTDKFKKLSTITGSYLTYNQISPINPSLEEIIEDIRSIGIEKALAIISKFTLYDEELRKKQIEGIKHLLLNPLDVENIDSIYLFDFVNLNYSIKMFLAYGVKNPIRIFNNDYSDTSNVFFTVLKITSLIKDKVDTEEELQKTILKTWLVNRTEDMVSMISRQNEIYQNIVRDYDKNKAEYIDIHEIFEEYYGYSIKDYISVLIPIFAQLSTIDKQTLLSNDLVGISEKSFEETNVKKIYKTVLGDLTTNIEDLKEWSLKTLNNFYDAEGLIVKPFFYYDNHYVIFSLPFLQAALFDGLWFKLFRCCEKKGKNFGGFFGRLFEQYVTNLVETSIFLDSKLPYKFIKEFKFGYENLDSSDAYIKIGNSLIIIEAKGGRIRKETKVDADRKMTISDFNKYAIKPILQANNAFEKIIAIDPNHFGKVKKICILSVSLQRFPKIPIYEDYLKKNMKKLNSKVKYYDYISIADLEVLCSHIENHADTIFRFIELRNNYSQFLSYEHFYWFRYGLIPRPQLIKSNFSESTKSIISYLKQDNNMVNKKNKKLD